MRSNEATPLSSQATASPSIMQERERKRANVSTISGKRRVRSLAAGSFSPAVGPLTRSERDQQFYCGLATSGYRLAVAVLATSSRSISDPINVVSIRAVPRKGGADKIADAADYSGAKRLYEVLASQWLRLAERAEETGGIDGAQKASADPMPRQEPQLTPPKSARLNASKTRFSHKREQHKRAPGG